MVHWRAFLFIVVISFSAQLSAEKGNGQLRIVTTEYSPYSYQEQGEAYGYSVEVMLALLEKVPYKPEIEFLPWARTYKTGLERPNTLIFSLARTPQREDNFEWIGKLFPMKTYLYIAANRNDIKITNLDEARKYVISGVIEGAPSKWLAEQGFEMFNSTGVYESRIRMLMNGRIDVLLSDPMSLETEMGNAGIDISSIKPILYLPEPSYDLYLAISEGSDSVYVEAFKQAYQQLVQSGQFERLTLPFHERYEHLSIPH